MPLQSYVQSNFWGGEWSPEFQGRSDDKLYPAALATCLNYIPNQEGSLSARGGTKRCGNTKFNDWARYLAWRFSSYESYLAEHTDDNLRIWANGIPVFSVATASLVSQSGNPPVFVVQDNSFSGTGFVPLTWADNDSIIVFLNDSASLEAAPYLANREFTLTIVDQATGQISLNDARTGDALSAAISGLTTTTVFKKIQDLATPYDFPEGVRQVQYTSQVATLDPNTNTTVFSKPDNRVTYLYPLACPRSLSRNSVYIDEGTTIADFALQTEKFIDGPYLDSPGPNLPVTVSAATGAITVVLHGYSALIRYMAGDCAYDSPNTRTYLSLKDGNIGNALPSSSPFVNADWAILRNYASGTTYAIGNVVGAAPFDSNGVPTVYYSKVDSNLGHTPATSGTQWGTTPPTWGSGTTYATGAVVTDTQVWLCNGTPTVGTAPHLDTSNWVQVNFVNAFTLVDSTAAGVGWADPTNQQRFFFGDAGNINSAADPSRHFRLKAAPQPWNSKWTYATGDLVNYNNVIYKSLTNSNLGNIPDQDATDWQIATDASGTKQVTIQWTWGEITAVTDQYTATVTLRGADLPNSNPIFEYRFGAFSDTTGWPTCGGFHEGRIWLAGLDPNTFHAGVPNQGFNFTPTAPDGTIADNSAFTYRLNSDTSQSIYAFRSTDEGMVMFTSEQEWLVSASSLNDPLTPTSIQAHPTTGYSAAPSEPTRLPSSVASVQNGGRRIFEYRRYIDMTSYQSRLNVLEMTRRCQHLTYGGVLDTQYQSLPKPVLWAAAGGSVGVTITLTQNATSPPNVDIPPIAFPMIPKGKLFGIGYMNEPGTEYMAPFSFEHGLAYKSGNPTYHNAIAVQRGPDITSEYLYVSTLDSNGNTYTELLMPPPEADNADDTFNDDGTVATFGTLSKDFMVDSGVTPAGAKIATDGLSVTFYGLWPHAGATVSFTCRGKYVGDYTIGSDGSVSVTFNTAFAITDLGRAIIDIVPNAMYRPAFGQIFVLDKNGNSGVKEPTTSGEGFFGQFGYAYRRRGQQLRPQVQSPEGGPPFAMLRRNHRAGVYVAGAQEISIGYTFSNLYALPLTKTDVPNSSVALGPGDFATGIFRDNTNDDWTFDGNLCWEQTRPVRGGILAVGGFLDLNGG